MIRAWRSADRFEGRSAQRRSLPMDLGPVRTPDPAHLADVLGENRWITPVADEHVIDLDGDPAQVVVERNTIRLAFVAAL